MQVCIFLHLCASAEDESTQFRNWLSDLRFDLDLWLALQKPVCVSGCEKETSEFLYTAIYRIIMWNAWLIKIM